MLAKSKAIRIGHRPFVKAVIHWRTDEGMQCMVISHADEQSDWILPTIIIHCVFLQDSWVVGLMEFSCALDGSRESAKRQTAGEARAPT